jgi:hypothetical protein
MERNCCREAEEGSAERQLYKKTKRHGELGVFKHGKWRRCRVVDRGKGSKSLKSG